MNVKLTCAEHHVPLRCTEGGPYLVPKNGGQDPIWRDSFTLPPEGQFDGIWTIDLSDMWCPECFAIMERDGDDIELDALEEVIGDE